MFRLDRSEPSDRSDGSDLITAVFITATKSQSKDQNKREHSEPQEIENTYNLAKKISRPLRSNGPYLKMHRITVERQTCDSREETKYKSIIQIEKTHNPSPLLSLSCL